MIAAVRKKSRRRTSAQRRRVCYHEAGHAIISELVGSDVKTLNILIDRPRDRWGVCNHSPSKSRQGKFLISMAGYAGELVESLNRGGATPEPNLIGHDVKGIEALASEWLGRRNTHWRRLRIYTGATIRAGRLLQQHYAAFDAVAKHLSRKRKLDGKTVRAALAMFRIIPSERGTTQ